MTKINSKNGSSKLFEIITFNNIFCVFFDYKICTLTHLTIIKLQVGRGHWILGSFIKS